MPENRLPQTANRPPQNVAVNEGEFEPLSLAEIVAIYKRWYKLGVYTFVGLLVPAVIVIFLILPLYEGHGSVWVDRNSPSVNFAVRSDPAGNTTFRNVNRDEEIATTAELFKAREIAEKLVADLDLTMDKLNRIRDARRYVQMVMNAVLDAATGLYDGIKNLLGLGVPLTEAEKAELEHTRVVDEVINRIDVTPLADSNVLGVSFRTSDPVLARDLVNALLDEFIDFFSTIREDKANEFFTESTERLKAELSIAENEILQLQKQTTNFMSREQEGSLVKNYEETKEALRRLKIQEARLKSQLASIRSNLKRAPNSVNLREVLQTNLINIETELAALMEEKRSTTEVMSEYRSELDTIASVNLNLRERFREATILEESYQINVRNLEKARAGQAMSSASMSAVRVVSYAPYPLKTVRPRKLLYLAIALGAALLVGLAMPLLAYLNDDTIADEADVRKYLGLEFVGTFPLYDKKNFG
jgi:polysaccharide biosynthesis transport protein